MPTALATPYLRFRSLASLLPAAQLRGLSREAVLILAGVIFFIGLAGTIGLRDRSPVAKAIAEEASEVSKWREGFRNREQD